MFCLEQWDGEAISVKALGFMRLLFLLICVVMVGGCVPSSRNRVKAAPVAVVVQEAVKEKPTAPPMTTAEREARSYNLGNHWWVPERIRTAEATEEPGRIESLVQNRLEPLKLQGPKSSTAKDFAETIQTRWSNNGFKVAAVHRPAAKKFVVVDDGPVSNKLTWWSTRGQMTTQSSQRSEALLRDLISEHEFSCVGTQGSSARSVKRSDELNNLRDRLTRLATLFEQVLFYLAVEDPRIVPAARTILEMLTPYLEHHAGSTDHVGFVLGQLPKSVHVDRHGLDTNEIVNSRRELEAEKWLLKSEWLRLGGVLSKDDKALVEIYGNEFGDFRDNFVLPMEESLAELRRIKIRFRRDGADSEAQLIGRFVGHVRLILDQVLEVPKVTVYQSYLDTPRRGVPKKPRKRLLTALSGVEASYKRLVTNEVADVTVERTMERFTKGAKRCVLVMDPSEAKGVVRSLIKNSANYLNH